VPIYEFECNHCGHRFDRLQKLSDTDPSICPACDAPQLRRRVSAPSFRLAGSGWYETDFKKDGDKKRNLVDTAGSDKPASSGDSAAAVTAAPAAVPAASKAAGSE
jgi:putative FmdB family regulatory protein